MSPNKLAAASDAPLRFLVADSEPPETRKKRREQVGCSNGETLIERFRALAPLAAFEMITPADSGATVPDAGGLEGYDAIVLSGSPLHMFEDTPEVRRHLDFMRAVFRSGTPSFGSCAGLQVATVAAGGTVRINRKGYEAGFARRIRRVDDDAHPLLEGRPPVFDAPAVHSDEVETLPDGARLLASNALTEVQAAEIRWDNGVFWGVQYHPELSLHEVAAALRRDTDTLIEDGMIRSPEDLEQYAGLIEDLGKEPDRDDLTWRLGLDEQVADEALRGAELRNFVQRLVLPTRAERGRHRFVTDRSRNENG